MGKRRDQAERKIDAFVEEMNAFAKKNGSARTLTLGKRARIDLVHAARTRKKTIEQMLELIRPAIEQTILAIEDAGITDAKGFTPMPGFPMDPSKLH